MTPAEEMKKFQEKVDRKFEYYSIDYKNHEGRQYETDLFDTVQLVVEQSSDLQTLSNSLKMLNRRLASGERSDRRMNIYGEIERRDMKGMRDADTVMRDAFKAAFGFNPCEDQR